MNPDRFHGDFGHKLREARERRGITLRQIAAATKISVSALEALERNDISRLPGGIFSRAFVRSYANQVGLDPEQSVQDFIAAFPGDSVIAGHPRSDRIEDNEALESDRQTASTFLRLIALSIPLAGMVVYCSTSGRPSPVAPPPASGAGKSAAPAAIAMPAVSASTAASPASAAVSTDRSRAAGTVSDPTVSGEGKVPLTVVLTVTRPCWLSATVDGRKLFERLLQSGESQSIEVTRELELTAGDASAVRMTINGEAARPFGKTGQKITARVNAANFKSYLSPR